MALIRMAVGAVIGDGPFADIENCNARGSWTHSTRLLDYPNSQDPGLTIGLCWVTNRGPLTMRTSDQMDHQARSAMPISTMHSGMPIARYSSPIQKVLI
jgi:hypothetical protein